MLNPLDNKLWAVTAITTDNNGKGVYTLLTSGSLTQMDLVKGYLEDATKLVNEKWDSVKGLTELKGLTKNQYFAIAMEKLVKEIHLQLPIALTDDVIFTIHRVESL